MTTVEVDFTPKQSSASPVFAYGYGTDTTVYALKNRCLLIAVSGRVMASDFFHELPECSWEVLMSHELQILGRLDLSPRHLDLLAVDRATGNLFSASAQYDARHPKPVREFIHRQWKTAPQILTQETTHNRKKINRERP